MEFTFVTALWLYPGDVAWYFLSLPAEYTEEIKTARGPTSVGFGSVKVQATIGANTWDTSIFPDAKSGAFLLPVKKEVRLANNLQLDELVPCKILIK